MPNADRHEHRQRRREEPREAAADEIHRNADRRDVHRLERPEALAIVDDRLRHARHDGADVHVERVADVHVRERRRREVPLRHHAEHDDEDGRRRERLDDRIEREQAQATPSSTRSAIRATPRSAMMSTYLLLRSGSDVRGSVVSRYAATPLLSVSRPFRNAIAPAAAITAARQPGTRRTDQPARPPRSARRETRARRRTRTTAAESHRARASAG